MTRIIAADDQPDVLEALRLLLKREGIAMVPATSPAGVLSALEQEDFDAALIDLNYARDTTSGGPGPDTFTLVDHEADRYHSDGTDIVGFEAGLDVAF